MSKGNVAITLVAAFAVVAVLLRKAVVVKISGLGNPENVFSLLTKGLGAFAILFAVLSIATVIMAWRKKDVSADQQSSLRERLQKTSWMRLIPFILALVCVIYLQEIISL